MQLSAELFSQIILGLHSDEATSPRHEKRREGRVGVRCSIEVTPLLFGDRGPVSLRVKVRDISPSGLGFISQRAMEVGVELLCKLPRFDQSKIELKMKVRHCVAVSKGVHNVGASFDRAQFVPPERGSNTRREQQGKRAGVVETRPA